MMHARKALGLAAGSLSALALSLSACGGEPAPQDDMAEATPPAATAPPQQDTPPQQATPPPQAEGLAGSEFFVPGQALPEGFPSDVPVPADVSYMGSFANQGLAARWTSEADVKQLTEQLRAVYEASDSWKLEKVRENGPEAMLLASRGTQGLIAAVSPEPSGGSYVDVFVLDISDMPLE